MISDEMRAIVGDRLDLVRQLTEAIDHFRGVHLIQPFDEHTATHPFRHYAALRIYLALTCFDILGQQDDWVDFDSWLVAKSKKNERDQILTRHEEKDFQQKMVAIHQDYNAMYGVRRSFYRFMREGISQESRHKLLKSIGAIKRVKEAVYNDDGSHSPPVGKRIELTDEMKEKFLFGARNAFTHKGISYGDPSGGVFMVDSPLYLEGKAGPIWLSQDLHTEKVGQDTVTYQVWRWPFVLIEIIEEVIGRRK